MKDSNRLIAEFMGYRYETGVSLGGSWSRYFKINGEFKDSFHSPKYDTSWDWLMPVVEKIEQAGYIVNIMKDRCQIGFTSDINPKVSWCLSTKIEATYEAIVEFIKYYNNITTCK